MGQIRGKNAHIDACNLRSLSSFGTPAAGQHILVSTDNSATADGQGNFDAYVEGDGVTAATALPLHRIVDLRPVKNSKQSVSSGGMYQILYEEVAEEIDYNTEITTSGSSSVYVNLTDLSAFEDGKTYKISVLAKETTTIRIQTRNSSAQTIQTICLNYPVTEGQTYEFEWTKQSAEVRLFSMDGSGKGYKCEFTISHEVPAIGLVEKVENNTEAIENIEREIDGGIEEITDYNVEITTSGSSSGYVNLTDLSAFEDGNTYKITLLAKETTTIRIQTRNSSNTVVQNIVPVDTPVTNGETYTWNWTKQSEEVRLYCFHAGVSFKCEFTISHQEETAGIAEKADTALALAQGVSGDVAEIDGKVGILDEELNGEKTEVSGYSLFTIPAYIRTNGTDTNPASGWMRTDFIDLDKFVSCKVWLHSSVASIAFYSSKNLSTFLGYAGSGTYGTEGTFNKSDLTIPAGTNYVIISTENNAGNNRPYTASSVTTIEVTTAGLTQRVEALEDGQGVTAKNKGFAHISFDDVVFCLHDITQNANTYTSIFDNDFFALLKTLHDTYGAVFSLFVFLEDATTGDYATGWTLANTTTQFATEFAANASWLKFGLHALNKNVNYAARSAADAATDYATFVTAIMSITGTTECIDRLPRLGNFAGGLEQMQALRDVDAGIIGGLAAYDTRDSYYLTSAESSLAYKKGVLIDAENHLAFYTSLNALEGNVPSTLFNAKNTPATMGRFFNLEWMMHEYAIGGQDYGYSSYDWNTMAQRLESACQISMNNGYTWEYPFVAALRAGL